MVHVLLGKANNPSYTSSRSLEREDMDSEKSFPSA